MATHDYVIANASGSSVRSDLNNALAAIVSNNSSSSEPSTKYPYMLWVDSTNNLIKLRNSSNNAWISLFTTAGGLSISAASTFNEDVTFDGATAGRDMVWDRSDNALEFADNAKLFFGGALSVYHDGNNHIKTSDGYLRIQVDGNNLYLDANETRMRSSDGGEILAKFIDDAACELYFDGGRKFRTYANGAVCDQHLLFADNNKILMGAGEDLEIFHDSSNSRIDNSTGYLTIRSNQIALQNAAGDHDYLKCPTNEQGVELYWDNDKRIETTLTGAKVSGYLLCERTETALEVYQSGTGDVVGSIFRHNRGGLSGYSGKMISFRGNDNTEEGSIVITVTATAYNTSSDYRLKENQVAISDGITRLKTLKPYRFNFKKDKDTTVDGFFAHEVTPAVPEAITGAKDAMAAETRYEEGDTIPSGKVVGDPKTFSSTKINPQQIDQSKLVPLLTAA